MPCPPAVEAREGLVLRLGPRDLDHGHGGSATPGGRGLRGPVGILTRGTGRGSPLLLGREALLHGRAVLLALGFGLGRVVLRRGAALLRGLDPRRLAGLLPVVRWPGRVALALGLVPARQLEQGLERPDC